MVDAAVLTKKSAAVIAAHRRAARAAHDAHTSTQAAKWAVACQPGPCAIRRALQKALAAQNRAMAEIRRADLVRADLAEVWRSTHA